MLKKIIINILILILLFFVLDFTVYIANSNNNSAKLPFQYNFGQYRKHFDNIYGFFNGKKNDGSFGRLPDGLEYKDSSEHSIVVFGCSFAYGQFLKRNQIFSSKLSHILKVPVYNRAIAGGGLQYMYKQSISPEFYEDVPYADTAIYIFMHDHYRRMYGLPFTIYDNVKYLHYTIRNNDILPEKDNLIKNLYESSYLYRIIRARKVQKFIDNEKNADYLTDMALTYLIKTRENLEKHYNIKIKFYVFYYEKVPFEELLTKKLKENNFYVYSVYDMTDADLSSEQYKMQDNGHPTEAAWDLLTPLFAEKITF